MKSLIIIALMLGCAGASAEVYRCVGPQGQLAISDRPCEPGSAGGQVHVQENTLDTSAARRLNGRAMQDSRKAVAAQECDAARHAHAATRSSATAVAMRQACGLPDPEPRRATVTNCSGNARMSGSTAYGTTTCVSR